MKQAFIMAIALILSVEASAVLVGPSGDHQGPITDVNIRTLEGQMERRARIYESAQEVYLKEIALKMLGEKATNAKTSARRAEFVLSDVWVAAESSDGSVVAIAKEGGRYLTS